VNSFWVTSTIKYGPYSDLFTYNLIINGIGKLGGKHAMITEYDTVDAGKKAQ
jgi:hypothetical protein